MIDVRLDEEMRRAGLRAGRYKRRTDTHFSALRRVEGKEKDGNIAEKRRVSIHDEQNGGCRQFPRPDSVKLERESSEVVVVQYSCSYVRK